jgi:luciferase family oxidoreductase group 1
VSKLRIGVVDQSPVRNGGTAEEALRETLELARVCERLGYSRYWLAEHHSTNSFAGSTPAVLIPAVAAATREIRVGSGGVLLPHWSPLHVAESFRLLQGLHPGRIDLGLGRAPGGTSRVVEALRYGRGEIPVDRFPEQVRDLLGWLEDSFEPGERWARVRAMPRVSGTPEVWILGSGGEGALYAAEMGCGYAFAQFISGGNPAPLVRSYHARFRASSRLSTPRAIVALGVICAEDAADAERLALSLKLWRMRVVRGEDRGIPSPQQAEEEFAGAGIDSGALADDPQLFAGDPGQVREHLRATAEACGVEELLVVTVTHSFEARIRSYELIAEVMGLAPR